MAGLEALGAIAAVSQMAVYVGRLVELVNDIRCELKGLNDEFEEYDRKLVTLSHTLQSTTSFCLRSSHAFNIYLKPIECRITRIRQQIADHLSRDAMEHGFNKLLKARSTFKAHQHIASSLQALEQDKINLLLYISSVTHLSVEQTYNLSYKHSQQLSRLTIESPFDDPELVMGGNKWKTWFNSGNDKDCDLSAPKTSLRRTASHNQPEVMQSHAEDDASNMTTSLTTNPVNPGSYDSQAEIQKLALTCKSDSVIRINKDSRQTTFSSDPPTSTTSRTNTTAEYQYPTSSPPTQPSGKDVFESIGNRVLGDKNKVNRGEINRLSSLRAKMLPSGPAMFSSRNNIIKGSRNEVNEGRITE